MVLPQERSNCYSEDRTPSHYTQPCLEPIQVHAKALNASSHVHTCDANGRHGTVLGLSFGVS